MKKCVKITLATLCISVLSLASAMAEEMKSRQASPAEVGKKAHCPVMNINFEVAKDTPVIDYKGKSYYFCCDHCVGDFKKDPDKFTMAGEVISRAPTASEIGKSVRCAVMDVKFEVAPSTPVVDYHGKSYYFCCNHCLGVFKKYPDTYAAK